MKRCDESPNFFRNIMFSDEGTFYLKDLDIVHWLHPPQQRPQNISDWTDIIF